MNKHIDMVDMASFLTYDGEFNDDFKKEATRINTHIATCDECKEMYFALLSLQDSLDECLIPDIPKVSAVSQIADILGKKINDIGDNISSVIENLKKVVSFKVNSYTSISSVDSPEFFHPMQLCTDILKSYDDSLPKDVSDSILTSEDSTSQITVYEDRSLIVKVSKSLVDKDSMVFLVEQDEEVCFTGEVFDEDDNTISFEFENISIGKYDIYIY